jgi:hypothetical protein
VGAVGETGIHIDRISIGDTSEGKQCAGKPDGFSVTAGEVVHVCFRVVHGKEPEQLTVFWDQDGSTKRRTKVDVPDRHAHDARARMKVRAGMAGQWVARVKSADGAELAKLSFSVGE